MAPIPMDWIDKLFVCMAQFYGERWTKPIAQPHMQDFYKTIWQSGLSGLTYEQIKAQLIKCKKHAEDINSRPISVMEFYQHAKNMTNPVVSPHANTVKDSLTAQQHMAAIKEKLNMVI
jgi:hypothetical protein